MKYLSTYIILLFGFLITACDHEYERVYSASPDDRVQETVLEYQAKLIDAPFGWNTSLYTGTGAGYFYHFAFGENGNVTMLSDFDEETAGETMESTWTVKALQRPTLSFTTYSYVHLPADPDGNINNGIPGSGLLSDFEFAFVRANGDSIVLQGLQHKAELIMTPATEDQMEEYYGKRIQELIQYSKQFLSASRGYILTLPNEKTVPLALSVDLKLISFQYLHTDDETIETPITSFIFTTEGIRLKDELLVDGYAVSELIWNEENNSFVVSFESPAILAGADDPYIFYPKTALSSRLGVTPVAAAIPHRALATPLPGQSESFTEVFQYAATQMLESEYRVTLEEIKFTFVPNTDRMLITLSLTQPVLGGGVVQVRAQYVYSYQVREGGVIKFRSEGFDSNAGLLYEHMLGILSHFDNDTFRIEYVGGDFNILAGFFSQEEPGYYFSGYLD